MTYLGRNQQTAIFQLFLDHLIGHQLSALEVASHIPAHLHHHFLLLLGQPDAIFGNKLLIDCRIPFKGCIHQSEMLDLSKAERLELGAIDGGEIPDPFVVDQLVRGNAGIAFFLPISLLVAEGNLLARNDGLFQFTKQLFLTGQLFVVVAFYKQSRLHSRVEDVPQKVIGQ